jgi:hypothetical protein
MDYKPTIIDKIKWTIQDIKYYPKNFIIGIKNLILWFPVIWGDRDWDQHYILEVLKFKIRKQAKCIGNNNFSTTSKRDAEIMNLASRLIDRAQNETYETEYISYYTSNDYFEEIEQTHNGEKLYEFKSDEISENFKEYFEKYPRQYKKAISGELRRFKRDEDESKNKQIYAMEISYENQERCHRLLFKILEENIKKWWN